MATLPVIQYGTAILRKKTETVTKAEFKKNKFQQFIRDMVETMYKSKGVGLAAPQVNSNKCIAIIDTSWVDESQPAKPIVLINPEIILLEGDLISEEGCLSFSGKKKKPAVTIKEVKRANKVTVKYLDHKFQSAKITAEGDLLARCLQHEIDHLNGILMIDHAISDKEVQDAINAAGYLKEYKADAEYHKHSIDNL